jgi:hypothetical protein
MVDDPPLLEGRRNQDKVGIGLLVQHSFLFPHIHYSACFIMRLSLISLALGVKCALALSVRSTPSSNLHQLGPRQNTSCENTATSRNCWGDYSIDTNWYDTTPDTGVVRGAISFPSCIEIYL